MISLCLFIQLAVVWFQTRKGAKAVMAREILIVMSALKPGFDAYRVANGENQDAGAAFTPEVELLGLGLIRVENFVPFPGGSGIRIFRDLTPPRSPQYPIYYCKHRFFFSSDAGNPELSPAQACVIMPPTKHQGKPKKYIHRSTI